jgi:hypothetical protein
MQTEEKKQIYCTLMQALHTAVGSWDSTVTVATVLWTGCPRDQIPLEMRFSMPVPPNLLYNTYQVFHRW